MSKRKKIRSELPTNWRITAINMAAREVDKSYARFMAEDIVKNPMLKEKILCDYKNEYLKKYNLMR